MVKVESVINVSDIVFYIVCLLRKKIIIIVIFMIEINVY